MLFLESVGPRSWGAKKYEFVILLDLVYSEMHPGAGSREVYKGLQVTAFSSLITQNNHFNCNPRNQPTPETNQILFFHHGPPQEQPPCARSCGLICPRLSLEQA